MARFLCIDLLTAAINLLTRKLVVPTPQIYYRSCRHIQDGFRLHESEGVLELYEMLAATNLSKAGKTMELQRLL